MQPPPPRTRRRALPGAAATNGRSPMKVTSRMRPARVTMLLALAATLAMLLGMIGPPGAGAQGKGKAAPDKPEQANCATGRTVPVNKISIQLWTFSRYITSGELLAGAPAD